MREMSLPVLSVNTTFILGGLDLVIHIYKRKSLIYVNCHVNLDVVQDGNIIVEMICFTTTSRVSAIGEGVEHV